MSTWANGPFLHFLVLLNRHNDYRAYARAHRDLFSRFDEHLGVVPEDWLHCTVLGIYSPTTREQTEQLIEATRCEIARMRPWTGPRPTTAKWRVLRGRRDPEHDDQVVAAAISTHCLDISEPKTVRGLESGYRLYTARWALSDLPGRPATEWTRWCAPMMSGVHSTEWSPSAGSGRRHARHPLH
ncbi:hypothetical protein [Streptomyces sp. NPDC057545]|uniref:hypothetical protein n=1 Tax=Streptomyces sp. NPDC057545 TaxID=3346164 RepID=UPI00368B39CA